MQETQVQSLGREDLLEKEMATHSSILAWEIPWTEEPGGLQSMGWKELDTTEQPTHVHACTHTHTHTHTLGLLWWLSGKESDCSAIDTGSVSGLGRSPGGRHGKPLQYSCLENPVERGAWWATVHRIVKSQTQLK